MFNFDPSCNTGRWQLLVGQRLEHRQWGEECVLFNDATGATHLLGVCVVKLLLRLKDEPANKLQLQVWLDDNLTGYSDQALTLDSILADLEAANLIERCQP